MMTITTQELDNILNTAKEMRNAQHLELITKSDYWYWKARELEQKFDNLIGWKFNDNRI